MTDHELVSKAVEMQKFSYIPYSRFPVGAALLCGDGGGFSGGTGETAAYDSTFCAAGTALVKAVSEGYTSGFAAIAIAGQGGDYCWPCGACRQMLYEFAPDLRVLAVRGDGQFMEASLRNLLPHGFGPDSLG